MSKFMKTHPPVLELLYAGRQTWSSNIYVLATFQCKRAERCINLYLYQHGENFCIDVSATAIKKMLMEYYDPNLPQNMQRTTTVMSIYLQTLLNKKHTLHNPKPLYSAKEPYMFLDIVQVSN
jgi:hypothetical protein